VVEGERWSGAAGVLDGLGRERLAVKPVKETTYQQPHNIIATSVSHHSNGSSSSSSVEWWQPERERETFIREKRRLTQGQSSIKAAAYTIIIKYYEIHTRGYKNNIQFRQKVRKRKENERGRTRDN